MTTQKIKKCLVPSCNNTSVIVPDKIFIRLPVNNDLRRKWLEVIVPPNKMMAYLNKATYHYVCEDHFNLEEDAKNFIHFKTIGARLFMKNDSVPHKNLTGSPSPLEPQISSCTKQRKSENVNGFLSKKRSIVDSPILSTSHSTPNNPVVEGISETGSSPSMFQFVNVEPSKVIDHNIILDTKKSIMMNNIKSRTFENMCRICMFTSDLICINDDNIIEVLQFLSGNRYSKTDKLPQQLCAKCLRAMIEIQTLQFQCQRTHLTLSDRLIDIKNKENTSNNTSIESQKNHKIEFIEIIEKNDSINQEVVTEQPNEVVNNTINFNENINKTEDIDIIEDVKSNFELVTEILVKDELLFEQMVKVEDITVPEPLDTNKEIITKPLRRKSNRIRESRIKPCFEGKILPRSCS